MKSSKLLVERIGLFPSSGNIHVKVNSSTTVVERMQVLYAGHSLDSARVRTVRMVAGLTIGLKVSS